MTTIFSNVFHNGHYVDAPQNLTQTLNHAATGPVLVSIGLNSPTEDELRQIADHYGLHPDALADALLDHQRAKLVRYDDVAFVVLRPATYLDAEERVEFKEVQAFVGPEVFIGVTRSGPDGVTLLCGGIQPVEQQPDLLKLGPMALLYGLFEVVADSYGPVITGLEEDIDQIEEQLFAGHHGVSRRIYELFNEVLEFQRATRPLLDMLDGAGQSTTSEVPPELNRRFSDVRERIVRIVERADVFRAQLQNALNVNSTLVAQQQNEDMKRISGWAAILFAPTLVGAIYGMNFQNMPELGWQYGYPLALGVMAVLTVGLYTVFKVKKWF